MNFSGLDEAEKLEDVGGAVLVGCRAPVFVESEDSILEGLDRFEELVDRGVEGGFRPQFLVRSVFSSSKIKRAKMRHSPV